MVQGLERVLGWGLGCLFGWGSGWDRKGWRLGVGMGTAMGIGNVFMYLVFCYLLLLVKCW